MVGATGTSSGTLEDRITARSELDSHTDMCCLGRNVRVLHRYQGRRISVTPFHDKLGSIDGVPVVSALMVYDDHDTGQPIFLVVNQAIYFEDKDDNLLCPMQLRYGGVTVHECPKHLQAVPREIDHTIILGKDDDSLTIPLDLEGITSYFPTRKPTEEEFRLWESGARSYDLTADTPEWEPQSPTFSFREKAMILPDGGIRLPQNDSTKMLEVGKIHVTQSGRGQPPIGSLSERQLNSPLSGIGDKVNVSTIKAVTDRSENVRQLAKTWGISLPSARRTILSTTQKAIRSWGRRNVERRFPSGERQLRYRRLNRPLFSDTFFSTTKSRSGNTCAHIFATDFAWSRTYPLTSKADAHLALDELFHRVGVPERLIPDDAPELVGGFSEYRKKATAAGCPIDPVDPHSPWQNRAEGELREVKRTAKFWKWKRNSPKVLWDHTVKLASLVRSNTAHQIAKLKGEVPDTIMFGTTADISFLCEFGWYDWVIYHESDPNHSKFPDVTPTVGRYLGPTDPGVGSTMSFNILNKRGRIVRRPGVRRLTNEEMNDPVMVKVMESFDESITRKLGPGVRDSVKTTDKERATEEETIAAPHIEEVQAKAEDRPAKRGRGRPKGSKNKKRRIASLTLPGDDIDDPDWDIPRYELYEDEHQKAEPLDDDHEGFDEYITARVILPLDDEFRMGTVKWRKHNGEGQPVGRANSNPILDTRLYGVEFDDGVVREYSANVIAENLYAQVDEEGRHILLMDSITAHRKLPNATPKEDEFFRDSTGRKHHRKNTKGWELCVQWKDGSSSWEPLAALKESNPVEVAEYAVAVNIASEPAYSWWVPYTLKRRDRIIAAVNKSYTKKTHKFGIEVPSTVKEALEIDKRTGTTFWADALRKEMKKVSIAFEILEDGEEPPNTYKEIRCHVVFDVKMGTLQRKARLVAGGHMTDPPTSQTYSSVVSRESVRIALTIAALNGLSVLTGDLENAYLQAPCEEKVWTRLGPEAGADNAGKKALVIRALYGLKSSGASFRNTLAECLGQLGFTSCKADPDVWLRKATGKDGFTCYEYLLCYVDDIMAVCFDPRSALERIDKYFHFKPGSIDKPDLYLGAKLRLTTTADGTQCWGQSSSGYILDAVKNVEKWAADKGLKLPTRCAAPMNTGYHPELDVSRLLTSEGQNYYQSAIGVLRWAIELGRIDIITETSMLASFSAMPRLGHLYAVLRIFAYLRRKHNGRLIFDPTPPKINTDKFTVHDWSKFYGEIKEAIPPNAPEPLGNSVMITGYVDADHAGDKVTRRSRTGYLIFVQSALIQFLSKKQGSVEGATFGSEFMAAKAFAEANRGLRYKLRMMGIPIEGPTYCYADNMSVLHNTTTPESTLKKKSNSIAYHLVREAVAMGELLLGYIESDSNPADVLTKPLPAGERRLRLVQEIVADVEG